MQEFVNKRLRLVRRAILDFGICIASDEHVGLFSYLMRDRV